MIYFVYNLIILTVCVFSVTTSQNHLVQTLVNYIPKEVVFSMIGSLTIFYSFINKKTNSLIYNNKFMFAFLVFLAIQFLWYFYKPMLMINNEGMYGFNIRIIRPTICLLTGVFLIKVFSETFITKEWINIFNVVCWMSFLLAVYSILQWCGIDWNTNIMTKNFVNQNPQRDQMMFTFLSHHTLTAAYLALSAPLCLMFTQHRYKIFLAVIFISLVFSGSIMALTAFMVSVSLFFILSGNIRFFLLMVLFSLCVVFLLNKVYPEFLFNSGRFEIWRLVITDVFKEKPFIGYGLGEFAYKYNNPNVILFAHNEYIETLFFGGIPALVILAGYILNLFYKIITRIKESFVMDTVIACCFVSLCILSFGTFIFHYPPLAVLGILYMAYIEYKYLNYRR